MRRCISLGLAIEAKNSRAGRVIRVLCVCEDSRKLVWMIHFDIMADKCSIDIKASIWHTSTMRTTLTIDEPIAADLKRKMQSGNGMTFKKVVNETLKNGLRYEKDLEKKSRKLFKIKARNLMAKPGFNFDKTGELLAIIESPDFK